jgi:hypothetical protein
MRRLQLPSTPRALTDAELADALAAWDRVASGFVHLYADGAQRRQVSMAIVGWCRQVAQTSVATPQPVRYIPRQLSQSAIAKSYASVS